MDAALPESIALAAALLGLTLTAIGIRGDPSRARPRCRKCWYNLAGLARCPECGWTPPNNKKDVFATRRNWRLVLAGLTLATAVPTTIAAKQGWRLRVPNAVAILAVGWTDAQWPVTIIESRTTYESGWCGSRDYITYALSDREWRFLARQSTARALSADSPTCRLAGLSLLKRADECSSVSDIADPAYRKAMRDPDATVRQNAAEWADRHDENTPETIAAFCDLLTDAVPDVRLAALRGLDVAKDVPLSTFPRIVALLDDPHPLVRVAAICALPSAGPRAGTMRAKFVEMAETDPVDYVRRYSIEGLGSLGDDALPALPFLIERLRSPVWDERHSAVIAIGKLGPSASAALPELRATIEGSIELPDTETNRRTGDRNGLLKILRKKASEVITRIRPHATGE